MSKDYKKDFDGWNEEKKDLQARDKEPFYNAREVWWCAIGTNIGYEQDGTGRNYDRPVVIVKGFNKRTFLAVPLTGRKKNGRYYFYIGDMTGRKSSAVLSQIRLLDTKRLVRKIGMLEKKKYAKLQEKLAKVIFDRKLE